MIVSPCLRQRHHFDNVSRLPSNVPERYGLEEAALLLGLDSPVAFPFALARPARVFGEPAQQRPSLPLPHAPGGPGVDLAPEVRVNL